MNKQTAKQLWLNGNNAGEGYAPDAVDVDEVVADLVNNYGGEIVVTAETRDEVTVVRCDDGELIAIGDAHGPWCVKIADTVRGTAR